MNHSPLPWHCFTDRDVNTGYVRKGIATECGWGLCEAQDGDNAAFIVHACNNFERLLAAAKNLVIGMKTGLDCAPFWTELIKEIAAIEAAKEAR